VGGIVLAHKVVAVFRGKRFMSREDKVTIIEGGGGLLDPEITIGHLAVPPFREP
jgi:hypothetical protein